MTVYEKHNNVNVWWFPLEFCQSRYGLHFESGTNSCTLISLVLADKMTKENVIIGPSKVLPKRTIDIFGEAMNIGNGVYGKLFNMTENKRKKTSPNLNIPEAMTALEGHRNLRFDLREWFYTHLTANPRNAAYKQSISNRIMQVFAFGIQLFKTQVRNNSAKDLLAALIADNRTTTFVFEFPQNAVFFFDSHQHGSRTGAVAAQTSMDNLLELSEWFVNMIDEVYNSHPSVYEITFLTTNANSPTATTATTPSE